MSEKQQIGKLGEDLATKYLEEKNYKILTRNFHCKQGEIDIIAKKNNEIIFVEVKARTNLYYGRPAEAVTKIKQKHIEKAAEYYLYKNNLANNNVRIDVIEVYIKEGKYKINHIKQVM